MNEFAFVKEKTHTLMFYNQNDYILFVFIQPQSKRQATKEGCIGLQILLYILIIIIIIIIIMDVHLIKIS